MKKNIIAKVVSAAVCFTIILSPVAAALAETHVDIDLSKTVSENEALFSERIKAAQKEIIEAEENEKKLREIYEAKFAESTKLQAEIQKLQMAKKNPERFFLENYSAINESSITVDLLLDFVNTVPSLKALNFTQTELNRMKALVEESLTADNLNRSLEMIKKGNALRVNPNSIPLDTAEIKQPQLPAIQGGELKVSADLTMFSAVSNAVSTVMAERNRDFNHHYFLAIGREKPDFLLAVFNNGYGENLAWGYENPFSVWFVEERLKYVKKAYESIYEVGHYTSLMNSNHKITGLTLHNTVMFGGLSQASEQCFGRDNTNKKYMDVETFQAALKNVQRDIDAQIAEKQAAINSMAESAEGKALAEAEKRTLAAKDKLKNLQDSQRANYLIRLNGSDRYETAYAVSEQMKKNKGLSKFDNIVVASGDNYPDALSGNYLAKVKKAPVILTNNFELNKTATYIKNNLKPGGTVYILGGNTAIPNSLELILGGIKTKRLGGIDRFNTNELILREAGVTNQDLLICSGLNFPDAVSASASGNPILLVDSDLQESQQNYLSTINPQKIYFIGGKAVISDEIFNKIDGKKLRLFGDNRFETSRVIAETLFPKDRERVILASGYGYPDALVGGAFNQDIGVPVLLVGDGMNDCDDAKTYVSENKTKSLIVLGGEKVINQEMINKING